MSTCYLSGAFGSGIRFLHLASAAALFNFLRSGCWADFLPPLLPIFRRKSVIAGVATGVIIPISFAFRWFSVNLPVIIKDYLLRFTAVAPVRLMDLRSGWQVRPEPGEAPGFVASAKAMWQVRPRERTFRFGSHLSVRLSFVARCFHCSNYYAKLVGNCKIYFTLFSLATLHP